MILKIWIAVDLYITSIFDTYKKDGGSRPFVGW